MQTIVITGASSGFGKAMAELLASRGHKVFGTSRKANVEVKGVTMLTMDVTDRASIEGAVKEVIQQAGNIDCLINNAGNGIGGAVELATPEEINHQLDCNLHGVVNVCQAVLPYMRQQGHGRIINMSSIAGIFTVPFQGFYSVSKRAIEAFSEALALECEDFGVEVVVIEPGDFATSFTGNRQISSRTERSEVYGRLFEKVLKQIESDEKNGGTAEMLAEKVVKIVESKSPKFRYIIAKDPLQKVSVWAYRLMPYHHYRKVLRMFYHM